MSEFWRLTLLFLALLAGSVSVFLAFQMQKQFKNSFASSYFYFVLFIFIFGSYSLAGSGMLKHFLTRMNAEATVIQSAQLYAIFLGIPFLVLAFYMYMKSIRELFGKALPRIFTPLYFFVLILAFCTYGFLMIRLTRFETGSYFVLYRYQSWAFAAILLLVFSLSFLDIIRLTQKSDRFSRSNIRAIGGFYLLYGILSVLLLSLYKIHPAFHYFLLIVFLAWHLIPIFLMNIYLEKSKQVEAVSGKDFDTKLQDFASINDISKRELDVIRLICAGFSNQEIAEALFISLQTVKDHNHRIFVKSGVKNRVQLSNMIR